MLFVKQKTAYEIWYGLVGSEMCIRDRDAPYLGRVAGPLTRTAADAAIAMTALARPDERDWSALPPASLDWSLDGAAVRGLRVGLWLDAGAGMPCHPDVRAVTEAAGRRAGEPAEFALLTVEARIAVGVFGHVRAAEPILLRHLLADVRDGRHPRRPLPRSRPGREHFGCRGRVPASGRPAGLGWRGCAGWSTAPSIGWLRSRPGG